MGIESILLGAQGVGAGLGAIGAYDASKGAKAAYEAQAQVADNNRQIATWQAEDAYLRGGKTATQVRLKNLQLQGDQRAALAANGVDLGVGSAAEIQADSDYFGKIDANQVVDNAAREAWGYRTTANNFGNDAAMLRSRADAESPSWAAATSLLGSATKVAGNWYSASKKGGGPPVPKPGNSSVTPPGYGNPRGW